MFKLGANSVLFGGFDLDTAMAQVAAAGYDGIELSAIQGMCEHLNLDDWRSQVKPIQELAAKHNLALLAIEEAALDEARLITAFQACAEIGIPVINIGPGGKADNEDDVRHCIATMAKLADKAAEYGVVLCVKAHVGAAIYSTPTTLRAMAEITSPGFGIDMDPSHIYRAGENPVDALRQVVGRIKHVHIRDCPDRGPAPGAPELQACGRGEVDLMGYLRVLLDAGYTGPVDLEVIGKVGQTPTGPINATPSSASASTPAGTPDWDILARCAIIAAESRGYLNACVKACAR